MRQPGDLAKAWVEFLADVEEARERLKCSQSGSWYRGHSDSHWHLTPTLMRSRARQDPDDWGEIGRREQQVTALRADWKNLLARKTKLKKLVQGNRTDAAMAAAYHEAGSAADRAKEEIAAKKAALERFTAPVLGERDLFDEYVAQAGKSHRDSSWAILGEMRHFGVPTRLLDWTARLEVALYFALERYRGVLKSVQMREELTAMQLPHDLPAPCLWILNPYRLSKRVSGRHSIWDVARERGLDYYDTLLLEREWPYSGPLPIYPPTQIERVRAQSGYFTVFGTAKDPLDCQIVSQAALTKLVIAPSVAWFCVRHVPGLADITEHDIFRDLDSLGRALASRYASMRKWREADE